MNHRERIGIRIRAIIDEQGISTYRLAELTGLHQPNIQRIITGKYSTGIDILAKIADILDYDLDFVPKNWNK